MAVLIEGKQAFFLSLQRADTVSCHPGKGGVFYSEIARVSQGKISFVGTAKMNVCHKKGVGLQHILCRISPGERGGGGGVVYSSTHMSSACAKPSHRSRT